MNNVRTVSDTKRDFYKHHTRPINSIYRRVVEELMVEMHLLSVNIDFRYDPIYGLGVVTTFDRFMQSYRPEEDKEAIFNALIKALEGNPDQYKQDAQRLANLAKDLPESDLVAWFSSSNPVGNDQDLYSTIQAIANNPNFKYSRLFAIGLFSLLETANPDLIKDEKRRQEILRQICQALHISEDKVQKDLDLYRSNLEKMMQVKIVLEDAMNADRKKREKLAQDKAVLNLN